MSSKRQVVDDLYIHAIDRFPLFNELNVCYSVSRDFHVYPERREESDFRKKNVTTFLISEARRNLSIFSPVRERKRLRILYPPTYLTNRGYQTRASIVFRIVSHELVFSAFANACTSSSKTNAKTEKNRRRRSR